MITRTPRPATPDTRQRLLVGKIEKHAGRVYNSSVVADRYVSLAFCLLTPAQLDARLTEAHAN